MLNTVSVFNATPSEPGPMVALFRNVDDMLTSLKNEIDENAHEELIQKSGGPHPGYRVERRKVYWGNVKDSNLHMIYAEYGEEDWGRGISEIKTAFATASDREIPAQMIITLEYRHNDPNEIYQTHYKTDFIVSMVVQEGVHKGMPYSAATKINKNGVEFSLINIVLGDILVRVYEDKPFDVKRLDDLQFIETDLMLPVYVYGEEQNPPTSVIIAIIPTILAGLGTAICRPRKKIR